MLNLKTPENLFKTSVIITSMDIKDNEVAFYGYDVDLPQHPLDEGWQAGNLGFVTSSVSELDTFERIQHLTNIVRHARSEKNNVYEYLVAVYKDCLWIYYRKTKPRF